MLTSPFQSLRCPDASSELLVDGGRAFASRGPRGLLPAAQVSLGAAWLSEASDRRLGHERAKKSCLCGQRSATKDGGGVLG